MRCLSMGNVILNHEDVYELCLGLGDTLHELNLLNPHDPCNVYPIPRGGIAAAYRLEGVNVVDNPEDADFFFDDIIDSGKTMQFWCDLYPGKPFLALIDKTDKDCQYKDNWVTFPWEQPYEGFGKEMDMEHTFTRLLQQIGEDPLREGLVESPARIAKAWQFWTSGYQENVAEVMKTFVDGSHNYDEMILVKNIPFYSHCEHHLAPFFGDVSIAYIPDGKILGLSKLSRVVDIFSRRLQVQERLTTDIAKALMKHLQAKGVGVVINARHLCMESRGIQRQGHSTTTSCLRGVLLKNHEARAEFMSLIK